MSLTSRSLQEINRLDFPSEIPAQRRLHYYAKGEIVPTDAEGMWQVCQGLVQLSALHANGEEAILGWVGTSMWFGSWLTYLQSFQAKALTGVYLMWYSQGELESSPELALSVLPQLGQRLRQAEALLAIAGQRRVENRLLQLLLLLGREFGRPLEERVQLSVRLTHQDLANAIGTSRVTITRLLGKLKQEGKLSFDRDRYMLLSPQAFGDRDELFANI